MTNYREIHIETSMKAHEIQAQIGIENAAWISDEISIEMYPDKMCRLFRIVPLISDFRLDEVFHNYYIDRLEIFTEVTFMIKLKKDCHENLG